VLSSFVLIYLTYFVLSLILCFHVLSFVPNSFRLVFLCFLQFFVIPIVSLCSL
jgi:hypothetical protein